jgi:hypothetical protein
MDFVNPSRTQLAQIIQLFAEEGWHAFAADPEATWRALTAPGTNLRRGTRR